MNYINAYLVGKDTCAPLTLVATTEQGKFQWLNNGADLFTENEREVIERGRETKTNAGQVLVRRASIHNRSRFRLTH